MEVELDIPDDVIAETMESTGAKTPEEAIWIAFEEYLRRCSEKSRAKGVDTSILDKDLDEMRDARTKRYGSI